MHGPEALHRQVPHLALPAQLSGPHCSRGHGPGARTGAQLSAAVSSSGLDALLQPWRTRKALFAPTQITIAAFVVKEILHNLSPEASPGSISGTPVDTYPGMARP